MMKAGIILGVLLSTLETLVNCVEEPIPEIYLQPRNFNPHPYEAGIRVGSNLRNTGPVLFPTNPEDDVQSNIITIPRQARVRHPVDEHPYSKVARKHRYRVPGRYDDEDSRVSPGVYEGLSNHAAKVLSTPPSELGKDYVHSSLSDQKKDYAFSYKVVDHLTGDDFSHSQSQNAKATNGEYRVKLPDGRVQIVSYTADRDGYKAEVKYEDEGPHDTAQVQQIPAVNDQIKPVASNSFDYQYDEIGVSDVQRRVPVYVRAPVVYTTDPARTTKISPSYDYVTASPARLYQPTPTGYYVDRDGDGGGFRPVAVQIVPRHKVAINGQHLKSHVVSSTAAPYTVRLEDPRRDYEVNLVPVSSTLAPAVDRGYSEVYISTPKYRIEHKGRHQDTSV